MRKRTLRAKPCIAVKLDAGFAFEALLLERLTELPEARREEWLRSLLLKGLQKECRELQKLNCQMPRSSVSISPAADEWRSTEYRAAAQSPLAAPITPHRESDASPISATIVSLTALRKMIGQDSRARATTDQP